MKKPMTQEERFVQMIETPVSTLIPRLAVPTIISMLVTAIYNTVSYTHLTLPTIRLGEG